MVFRLGLSLRLEDSESRGAPHGRRGLELRPEPPFLALMSATLACHVCGSIRVTVGDY